MDDLKLSPGKIIAITPYESMKRAALLFDHITYPGFTWTKLDDETDWLERVRMRRQRAMSEREKEFVDEVERLAEGYEVRNPHALMDRAWIRSLARVYEKKGQAFVFLYDEDFGDVMDSGKSLAYKAVLNGLALVDEKSLTLDMVNEFRSDPDATRKYRELRLWLSKGLTASSIAEATDIVGKKIEEYEWAIKKHGLKTVTGAIQSILDSKYIAAIAGGAGAGAMLAGPVGATITAGLALGAGISAWIADRAIELEDIKRGENAELAIVYDAKHQFCT